MSGGSKPRCCRKGGGHVYLDVVPVASNDLGDLCQKPWTIQAVDDEVESLYTRIQRQPRVFLSAMAASECQSAKANARCSRLLGLQPDCRLLSDLFKTLSAWDFPADSPGKQGSVRG